MRRTTSFGWACSTAATTSLGWACSTAATTSFGWACAVAAVFAFFAAPVLAQSGTTNAPPGELTFRSSSYFELLLRTVMYLVVISLLIYVGLRWVYPRIFRWNVPAGRKLTVMDRLPMGGTRSVCVLRVGEHYYLVGVTDGQIQLMTELDAAEMAAYYGSARGGSSGTTGGGSAGTLGAPGSPGATTSDTPPWKRFLSGTRGERNLKE